VALSLHAQHPRSSDAVRTGRGQDTAGQGETTLGLYQEAMARGLTGDTLRKRSLQYGTTLLTIGRIDDSPSRPSSVRESSSPHPCR